MKKTSAIVATLIVLATSSVAGDFRSSVTNILATHPKGYQFSVPLTNRANCNAVTQIAKGAGFHVTTVRTNGFLRITASK
jgi:hypothetical protein